MDQTDDSLPTPKVGEKWVSFRHYKGTITAVNGSQITWVPDFWGHTGTYGISEFREMFTKAEDAPKGE